MLPIVFNVLALVLFCEATNGLYELQSSTIKFYVLLTNLISKARNQLENLQYIRPPHLYAGTKNQNRGWLEQFLAVAIMNLQRGVPILLAEAAAYISRQ